MAVQRSGERVGPAASGDRYTIGALAKAAGVPVTTIRYYERVGLLNPVERTSSNYRVYDASSLERLRFIRAAQGAGFALEDIAVLLNISDNGAEVCRDVQGLIRRRLGELKERLRELQHLQNVLKRLLARCEESERKGRCAVIEELRRRH